MSGTSLDGIDVALSRFDEKNVVLISFYSMPFQTELRAQLLELATARMVEMDALVQTHFTLAKEYERAVHSTLQEAKLLPKDIRAIGLHGQTVRHLTPPPHQATLQLGSGSALAARSGIDVVSDFRSADIALGGQGAPLMPMFDSYFLRSDSVDRLILNIGGIANVTWLKRNAREEDVIAFDTGPGNMLLDSIARRYFDLEFDTNGEISRGGTINQELLSDLLSNPYFTHPPPKSTGRELFSEAMLQGIHHRIAAETLRPADALATLTEVTARSIAQSLQWTQSKSERTEIIVSGGGAFNPFLLERLAMNLPKACRIVTSAEYGIPPKAKEAVAFAFFAKAFLDDLPIHLPSTTGATRRAILGSLSKGVR